MIEYVGKLKYEEEPDYKVLRDMIKKLLCGSKGPNGKRASFEWQKKD